MEVTTVMQSMRVLQSRGKEAAAAQREMRRISSLRNGNTAAPAVGPNVTASSSREENTTDEIILLYGNKDSSITNDCLGNDENRSVASSLQPRISQGTDGISLDGIDSIANNHGVGNNNTFGNHSASCGGHITSNQTTAPQSDDELATKVGESNSLHLDHSSSSIIRPRSGKSMSSDWISLTGTESIVNDRAGNVGDDANTTVSLDSQHPNLTDYFYNHIKIAES